MASNQAADAATGSQPNRTDAKNAMSDREDTDPEMDAKIAEGAKFQLDMIKENHRHAEATHKTDLGFLGKAFGGEKSAPTFVAMLAMIVGLVGAGAALGMAASNPETTEFWGTQVERAVAFASAALAFIFGRGSKQ